MRRVTDTNQKEFILLAVSGGNQNIYFPAVHSQALQFLGVKAEVSHQVTLDHHQAKLADQDVALLDFARQLAQQPHTFAADDVERLRAHGFSEEQILEAVLMVGLTNLLNVVRTEWVASPTQAANNLSAKGSESRVGF